jgi:ATP-dependent helicase/DNAse subunit B
MDGWERRLDRALAAFDRPTRLTDREVLAELAARTSFRATELEYYADCPSIWFFNRVIDPRSIDARPDALLRGILAHTTLHRFFAGLPRKVGVERPDDASLDACLAFLRECLDGALAGGVRLDLTDLERHELEQTLRRDLEAYVRKDAAAPRQLVPRRFEVSFGTERSAPELQRGLDLGDGIFVSGKVDRIDVDPWSARGIVVDYKSGKNVHSAAEIERELRLQVPLYMLVLRDLVGIEPLGGVYQALAGERAARGMLRAESADDGVPGFAKNDYLDEDAFWAEVELARSRAREYAERIRRGEVEHRPRWGECPAYCDKAPMCRVPR